MRCACGEEGIVVLPETVANHTNPEYWRFIEDEMYFCRNPDCEIVYFGKNHVLTVKEVKTKVFHKEKGRPRPLCYCNKVTVEDVLKAIENGAKTLEEIEEITGLGSGENCFLTNPTGRCCREYYVDFLSSILP